MGRCVQPVEFFQHAFELQRVMHRNFFADDSDQVRTELGPDP